MRPGQHTPECARKALESVMRRAYRRPVTPAEVDSKYKLVAVARKEGDSIDEGVRLALEADSGLARFPVPYRARSQDPQRALPPAAIR